MVEEDISAGRLVCVELEGLSSGILLVQAIYPSDQFPGLAGRWLLDCLSRN